MDDLEGVSLNHWDIEQRNLDSLLKGLTSTVEDHFADYVLWEEAGPEAVHAFRVWVKRLVSRSEDFAGVPWDRHWVESAGEVLSAVSEAHEQRVAEWEAEIQKAREWLAKIETMDLAQFAEHAEQARALGRLSWQDHIDKLEQSPPKLVNPGIDVIEARKLAVRGVVAEQLVAGIAGAQRRAARTLKLLALLSRGRYSERVASYLGRCGQCYLNGSYPETVVMCCAAVEQRLEDIAKKTQVAKFLGRAVKQVTLVKRVAFAEEVGVFSRADAERCWTLVGQRNDIIHFSPAVGESEDVALAALETMRTLLARLEVIGPS